MKVPSATFPCYSKRKIIVRDKKNIRKATVHKY